MPILRLECILKLRNLSYASETNFKYMYINFINAFLNNAILKKPVKNSFYINKLTVFFKKKIHLNFLLQKICQVKN